MELTYTGSSVTTSGISSGKFRLEFNPKMVKLLSDGLYSNKIRGIMRELSCNGLDSHTANGNPDKPFDIHLPTQNECYFSIRDYGTGLSEENIVDIYTVYGCSNKTNSNDYVGCLGIGSKSPFCYNTKTFTVKSYYNGKVYLYSLFLDSEGMPSYLKMSENDTSEPNGVYIEIPVASKDAYLFDRELSVFTYFKVKPNLNFGTIPEFSYVQETDLYSLRSYGQSNAIMGSIAYPIDINNSTWTEHQKQVLKQPLDLYFEIGKLDIGNGRESLSYDNLTINRIKARIDNITSAIAIKINDELSQCKSLWDARTYCADLTVLENNLIDRTKLQWNGKKIYNGWNLQFNIPRSEFLYNNKLKKVTSVSVSKKLQFYEFDLKIGNYVRIRTLDRVLVVIPENKDKIKSDLGITDDHILKVSTIPYTVTKRTYTRSGSKTNSIMIWQGYSSFKTHCWKNEVVDLTLGGYYVPWKKYEAQVPNQNSGIAQLVELINNINSISNVYGIKEKLVPKLNSKWINLHDYAKSLCTNDTTLVEKYRKHLLYQQVQHNYNDFIHLLQYPDFVEILEGSKIPQKDVALYRLQCYTTGVPPIKDDSSKIVVKLIKDFCVKYPIGHYLFNQYDYESQITSAILTILKEKLCLPQS